ncbi:MAG: TolB family protein, partial [Vicinamibacteria bacterium]
MNDSRTGSHVTRKLHRVRARSDMARLDRRTKTALAVTLGAVVCLSLGIQEGAHPFEVTFEEGTNFAVALSPDGSNLVLDLQGTLWSLPVEGGEGRALTDGLGDDRLPDYSPDGRRVVFQSYRSGSWDLWAIGSDGNGLEPLTRGPFDDREPVWSPDGTSVAFSSDRSGNYDIWILNVASGEVAQLTSDEEDDYMPTWSPDGSGIAFLSDRGVRGTTELWRIGARGGQESQSKIASFEGRAASPSWSPDGRQIVLQLLVERVYDLSGWRFSEGIASDLVVVQARGGEFVRRTSTEDVFPFRAQWMSEGGLLYTSDGLIRRLASGEAAPHTIPFSVKITLNRPSYP